jgi:hypothetical protein
VRRALQAPARQIVENAGADAAVIAGKQMEQADANQLITTQAMVAERPERHPAPAISAGGMGLGGMEFEKMVSDSGRPPLI